MSNSVVGWVAGLEAWEVEGEERAEASESDKYFLDLVVLRFSR